MGNFCGKESDAFAQPGRRLGDMPSVPTTASVPASASAATTTSASKVGGPPRKLGSSGSGGGFGAPSGPDEARRKAAQAAEARAQSAKKGDLSKKLAEQKKLTHRATLEEASKKNLREREVDAAADTLRHG